MPPHCNLIGADVATDVIRQPRALRTGRSTDRPQARARAQPFRVLITALALSVPACSNNNRPPDEIEAEGQAIGDLAGGVKVDAAAADSFAAELPPLQPSTVIPYDTVGEVITSASIITPAMISRGRELFHGRGKGSSSCSTCHGNNGGGALTGPELRSGNFRNITGKYNSIIKVVTVGVAQPKQFVGLIMPPMGGVQMTERDIRAVSAYVYTLAPRSRRQTD